MFVWHFGQSKNTESNYSTVAFEPLKVYLRARAKKMSNLTFVKNNPMKSRKPLVYAYGIFTLHGNGTGTGTRNGTGTIGNNRFLSLPLC